MVLIGPIGTALHYTGTDSAMSLRSFFSSFRSTVPASVPSKAPPSFHRAAGLGIGTIRKAALARSGGLVALATSSGVAVYQLDKRGQAWSRCWFEPTASWAVSVSWAASEQRVAASTNAGKVMVWDAASGNAVQAFQGEGNTCVALDAQGGRIAVGDTSGVTLWNVDTGAREHSLVGTSLEVTAVAFHPSMPRVGAVDHSGHALLWDADTGRELRRWQCARPLRDLAFSADGALVAAVGKDWTLWDVDTGMQIHSATAPGPMISVAFSRDGQRLITGTSRNRALIWDLSTGARLQDAAVHLSEVHSVASGPDDEFLMVASQKLQLCDAKSGALMGTLPAFARLLHVCMSPDSGHVALADKQVITVWDRERGEPLAALDGHTHTIQGLWFRNRGQEIVSHTPREIICWDVHTGKVRYRVGGMGGVGGASLSRDGRTLAAAIEDRGTYTLALWNADTGEETRKLTTVTRQGMGVHELALSPDASLLAVRASSRVTVWDVAGGGERLHMDAVANRAGALVWSPDGKTLATAMQSGEVVLWQAMNGRKRRTLSGADGGATRLVFSHDGTLLSGSFKSRPADQILVWDAGTGRRVHGPLRGGQICQALTFQPDNSALVAGFSDSHESGLWLTFHMATGEAGARHEGEAIWVAMFDESGSTLLTGTGEGTATLWTVSTD